MVSIEAFEAASRVGVFVVSTVLFLLMLLAYLRVRTPRMLGVASSFALFFAGGIVLFLEVLNEDVNAAVSEGVNYSITLVALVTLAAALLKGA